MSKCRTRRVSAGGKVPAVRRRFQKGTFVERNGVWTGMYREYVTQPDGSQKSVQRAKAFPGMSERAARAAFQPILDRVNAANGAEAELAKVNVGRTLADAVAEWRKLVAVNLKPRGRETAESHLRAHIIPKLGSVALSELNVKRLQQFVAEIVPGRSGKTVENIMLTLSGILGHARKWYKGVEKISLSDLSMPEKVKAKPRVLPATDLKRLIAAAHEPFKTILLVLASTGMRINEVLGLRVEDVDFRAKVIHVVKSAYNGTLGTPKSEASVADVPLSPPLEKKLLEYLSSEHFRQTKLGVLFANRRGRPYSDNKLREKKLRPLLAQLGMKPAGFHAIRHGVASELIEAGAPITVVRDQLRHSDVRITLGIYGHVIGDSQRRAVNRLAKRLIA